jgi:excisionase family DNA binding protein
VLTKIRGAHVVIPTEQEIATSKELAAKLSTATQVQLLDPVDDSHQHPVIAVPQVAIKLLSEAWQELAKGNAVTLVPIPTELSIREAAELLHLPLSQITALLDQNLLPFQSSGRSRRIKLIDLMAYDEQCRQVSENAMSELAAQAQELGMGYE